MKDPPAAAGVKLGFLTAWILENGFILVIAWLMSLALAIYDDPTHSITWPRLWANIMLAGFVNIEGSMIAHHWLATRFYASVPWLEPDATKRPPILFSDWLHCQVRSQSIAAALSACFLQFWEGGIVYVRIATTPFDAWGALVRLAIARGVSDVAFYWAHRALHAPALYFLHKRHHEHKVTSLGTNYHFSPVDQVLEGFMPALISLFVLSVLYDLTLAPVFIFSTVDIGLLFSYNMWYQVGSHCGKQVPTVSFFPPLSIVYNLWKNVDAGNVIFHQNHHAKWTGNFGITPMLDFVFGTTLQAKDLNA